MLNFIEPCLVISIHSNGSSAEYFSKPNTTKSIFGHYNFKLWDKKGFAIYHRKGYDNKDYFLRRDELKTWMVSEYKFCVNLV